MKLLLMLIVFLSLFSCREKAAEKVSVYQKNKVPEYPKVKKIEPSRVELTEAFELESNYALWSGSINSAFKWANTYGVSNNKEKIED